MDELAKWVETVMDVYHRAKETTEKRYTDHQRSCLKVDFERELLALCKPYVGVAPDWIGGR